MTANNIKNYMKYAGMFTNTTFNPYPKYYKILTLHFMANITQFILFYTPNTVGDILGEQYKMINKENYDPNWADKKDLIC